MSDVRLPTLWPKAPFMPRFRSGSLSGPRTYPRQPDGSLSDVGALFVKDGQLLILLPKGGTPSFELVPYDPNPRKNNHEFIAQAFGRYGAGWWGGQNFGTHSDPEGMIRRTRGLPHDAVLDPMEILDAWFNEAVYEALKRADLDLLGGLPPAAPPPLPPPPPLLPLPKPIPGSGLSEPGQRVDELWSWCNQQFHVVRPVLIEALKMFRKAGGR